MISIETTAPTSFVASRYFNQSRDGVLGISSFFYSSETITAVDQKVKGGYSGAQRGAPLQKVWCSRPTHHNVIESVPCIKNLLGNGRYHYTTPAASSL